MASTTEIKLFKASSILEATEKDSLYCIKSPTDTEFRIVVTDKYGNPINQKDNSGGGTLNIESTDGSISITGTTTKNLKIATALQNLINSALQTGDNISSLTNDSAFITLSDIPNFNPADYDLDDFTNSSIDPYARVSQIVAGSGITSVVAGNRVTVDNTDPLNPEISADLQPTNLGYIASPTNGVVTSDTGVDATIPLADTTNAGLITSTEKSKIATAVQPEDLGEVATSNQYGDLDGIPSTFTPSSHTHVEADITDLDKYTKAEVDGFLSDKFDNPTGDNTQYLDGAGNPTPFPTIPTPQNLNQTLTEGRNTGGINPLVNDADAIELENGSLLKKGTNDFGGSGGISQICSIGYEENWQAGIRYVFDSNGFIRTVTNGFNIIPDFTFDSTKKFKIGSIWILDDETSYICIDDTIGSAVWSAYNRIPTTANDVGALSFDGSNASTDVDLGVYNIIANSVRVRNTSGNLAVLQADNLTANRSIQWQDKNYSSVADITDIPTKNSELTNDSNFISEAPNDSNAYVRSALGWVIGYTKTAIDNLLANINTDTARKDTVKLSENISKGQAVYISSANGTNIIVSKASNVTEATSSKVLGLLETTGVTNDIVKVINDGPLSGLNTSSATIGDAVWLGINGNLIFGLSNKPVAPAHLVYIGIVSRVSATVGEIIVKVQNGFELSEIHDVLLTSKTNEDFLQYDSSSGLWKNFQISVTWLRSKLDSIYTTSSAVATQISNALSSYVPTSRTINSKALSSNITLTASDVGAPSGSGSSSGTNTGDQDLSSLVIKNTAITGSTKTKITYDSKGLVTSGADATTDDIQESITPTNKWWTNTRTITSVLTGLTASSGTFLSTDSLLTAFGKLKYLLDNIATNTISGIVKLYTTTGTNTDGTITQKGITDELALKQPLLTFTPYKFLQTSQTAHTGTTSEAILATATILGGTFNSNDVMKLMFKLTKGATTSNVTIRLKINTTNSLTGATQIGIFTFTTANTFMKLVRTFDLQGGNLYGYNFASSLIDDAIATNTTGNSTTYNTANILYLFFTAQLGTSGDSVTPNLANITN